MKRAFLYLLLLSITGAAASSIDPPSPALPSSRFTPHPRSGDPVLIAAAADLKFAMDSLINIFTTENPGANIRAVYGSSGNFFEQISNGAPFDLFFSADLDYPKKLQEQNKTLTPVRQYATGQIVLWSKQLDPARAQMNTLLLPSVTKISIANPAHAPYGKRAQESLIYYKIYDKLKDKLVLGENISQAAQFVKSGAADIGIIALSLALSPPMQQEGGKYWLIPADTHLPLQQGYVVLQHAKDNAVAVKFADFAAGPEAASVLQHFGLGKP